MNNAEGFCVTRAYILWDCYVLAFMITVAAACVFEGSTKYKLIGHGFTGASVAIHIVLVMHTSLFGLLRPTLESERAHRRFYNILAIYAVAFFCIYDLFKDSPAASSRVDGIAVV